jgi:hypothetical protein
MDFGVEVTLTRNCRNTRQICQAVSRLLGRRIESNNIEGPEIELVEVDRHALAVCELKNRLNEMIAKGNWPRLEGGPWPSS